MQRREGDSAASAEAFILKAADIAMQIWSSQMIFIGAVNGAAAGAGANLALACDFRLFSDTAFLEESFVLRGLIPDMGGHYFLAQMFPSDVAMKMLLLGERIGADELYRLGLATDVVAPTLLLQRSVELAQRVAAMSPHALRYAKRIYHAAQTQDLGGILAHEALAQAICSQTREHLDLREAFLNG